MDVWAASEAGVTTDASDAEGADLVPFMEIVALLQIVSTYRKQ